MADLPKTEKQLTIYKELHRIKQGWIAFWFILATVAALTGAFLYCIFGHVSGGPTTISGVLDGLFGVCLRAIIKFHFPSADDGKAESGGIVTKLLSKL
jgi:hypothetical protein